MKADLKETIRDQYVYKNITLIILS